MSDSTGPPRFAPVVMCPAALAANSAKLEGILRVEIAEGTQKDPAGLAPFFHVQLEGPINDSAWNSMCTALRNGYLKLTADKRPPLVAVRPFETAPKNASDTVIDLGDFRFLNFTKRPVEVFCPGTIGTGTILPSAVPFSRFRPAWSQNIVDYLESPRWLVILFPRVDRQGCSRRIRSAWKHLVRLKLYQIFQGVILDV